MSAFQNYRIPFGKYRNETIGDLMINHGSYLLWLLNEDWIKDDLKEKINAVLDDIVLDFGRHKGKTLSAVKSKDPKYFGWIMTRDTKKKEEDSDTDSN